MNLSRFAPLFWLALIFLAGGTLMKISYEVDMKERELARLETQIKEDSESIRVLKAEWAYLNQPQRLEKLVEKYLKLQPMQTSQMQAAMPEAVPPQVATAPSPVPPEPAAAPAPTTGGASIAMALPASGIIQVAVRR